MLSNGALWGEGGDIKIFLNLQEEEDLIFFNMKMSFQGNRSTWHRFCFGEENAFENPTSCIIKW